MVMGMRKNCETCKHEDYQYYAYPFKTPCDKCETSKGSDIPSEWEAAEHYEPDTNADRIRSMSNEDLAKWLAHTIADTVWDSLGKEGVPFSRVCAVPEYYYQFLEWLQQSAEEE